MRRSPRPAAESPRPCKRTAAASDDELLDQSRAPPPRADARRLHDGRDQVRLRPRPARASCGCSRSPTQLGEGEAVRIVPTLLALHALARRPARPPRALCRRDRRQADPRRREAGLATSVDAFCETIAFTPEEVERLFKAAAHHGLRVRLHAEQLSNQHGAALAAAISRAVGRSSRTSRRGGRQGDGRGRARSRCCCPALSTRSRKSGSRRSRCCASTRCRSPIATDCNPGTSPMLSPTLAMNMACTLFGLTPEEALAGMTINAARALGLAHAIGSIAAGQAGGPVRLAHRIACRARLLGRPAGAGAAHLRGAGCVGLRAALVAIVCWAGLAIQFAATYGHQHDVVRDALGARALLYDHHQPRSSRWR